MEKFVTIVEKIAGYFIGLLAIITFTEAILRYVFNNHIPDGFILGQMMQGIAICWGIGTAVYADRHITVDIVYELASRSIRRIFDTLAQTLSLAFMALFSYGATNKAFDSMQQGDISDELRIPLWIGFMLASAGIAVAFLMSMIRWWRVVIQKPREA